MGSISYRKIINIQIEIMINESQHYIKLKLIKEQVSQIFQITQLIKDYIFINKKL